MQRIRGGRADDVGREILLVKPRPLPAPGLGPKTQPEKPQRVQPEGDTGSNRMQVRPDVLQG